MAPSSDSMPQVKSVPVARTSKVTSAGGAFVVVENLPQQAARLLALRMAQVCCWPTEMSRNSSVVGVSLTWSLSSRPQQRAVASSRSVGVTASNTTGVGVAGVDGIEGCGGGGQGSLPKVVIAPADRSAVASQSTVLSVSGGEIPVGRCGAVFGVGAGADGVVRAGLALAIGGGRSFLGYKLIVSAIGPGSAGIEVDLVAEVRLRTGLASLVVAYKLAGLTVFTVDSGVGIVGSRVRVIGSRISVVGSSVRIIGPSVRIIASSSVGVATGITDPSVGIITVRVDTDVVDGRGAIFGDIVAAGCSE